MFAQKNRFHSTLMLQRRKAKQACRVVKNVHSTYKKKISISLANDFCTLCMLCHNMKYSFLLVTIALLLPTVKWVQNEQNTLHRVIQ